MYDQKANNYSPFILEYEIWKRFAIPETTLLYLIRTFIVPSFKFMVENHIIVL